MYEPSGDILAQTRLLRLPSLSSNALGRVLTLWRSFHFVCISLKINYTGHFPNHPVSRRRIWTNDNSTSKSCAQYSNDEIVVALNKFRSWWRCGKEDQKHFTHIVIFVLLDVVAQNSIMCASNLYSISTIDDLKHLNLLGFSTLISIGPLRPASPHVCNWSELAINLTPCHRFCEERLKSLTHVCDTIGAHKSPRTIYYRFGVNEEEVILSEHGLLWFRPPAQRIRAIKLWFRPQSFRFRGHDDFSIFQCQFDLLVRILDKLSTLFMANSHNVYCGLWT